MTDAGNRNPDPLDAPHAIETSGNNIGQEVIAIVKELGRICGVSVNLGSLRTSEEDARREMEALQESRYALMNAAAEDIHQLYRAINKAVDSGELSGLAALDVELTYINTWHELYSDEQPEDPETTIALYDSLQPGELVAFTDISGDANVMTLTAAPRPIVHMNGSSAAPAILFGFSVTPDGQDSEVDERLALGRNIFVGEEKERTFALERIEKIANRRNDVNGEDIDELKEFEKLAATLGDEDLAQTIRMQIIGTATQILQYGLEGYKDIDALIVAASVLAEYDPDAFAAVEQKAALSMYNKLRDGIAFIADWYGNIAFSLLAQEMGMSLDSAPSNVQKLLCLAELVRRGEALIAQQDTNLNAQQ